MRTVMVLAMVAAMGCATEERAEPLVSCPGWSACGELAADTCCKVVPLGETDCYWVYVDIAGNRSICTASTAASQPRAQSCPWCCDIDSDGCYFSAEAY